MNIQEYIALMDPELRAGFLQMKPFYDSQPTDLGEARQWLATLMAGVNLGSTSSTNRVVIEDRRIPGPDGAPEVPIRIYRPTNSTALVPGLLYIHGGGFTLGDLNSEHAACLYIVEKVGCVLVSVDYRLAPEHPFPAAPEDCYAALTWMATHSQELGIDSSRIGVQGGSAGGGLCAAVALMARDRKEVKLIFQLPMCACLDDRHITPSSHQIADEAMVWGRPASLKGWQAYLGADHQGEVSAYAAPARAEDLSGLPPTYMTVGTLDMMRDENIDYAQRLMQADVPTELHVYPGGFHGFEGMVPNAAISVRATNEQIQALKRGLFPPQTQDEE